MSSFDNLLEIHHATKRFGGVTALEGVSFDVAQAEILGVIGPNGAGKSTLFNVVSGLETLSSGRVNFAGRDMHEVPAHRRSDLGMTRTFQLVRLFEDLTVLENVMLGGHCRSVEGFARALVSPRRVAGQERSLRREALGWLETVGAGPIALQRPQAVPHGLQRLVEIARAMMGRPRLLLLDEPAAGLNGAETEHLEGVIRAINARGVAVLLVEHDVRFIMDLCHRIVVLDHGSLIAIGTPGEVRRHEDVIAAYLGRESEDAAH